MTYTLDSVDRQILKMIVEDARVPFLEVARACNLSGAAIHQRIQKLTSMGVIKGSISLSTLRKSAMKRVPTLGST